MSSLLKGRVIDALVEQIMPMIVTAATTIYDPNYSSCHLFLALTGGKRYGRSFNECIAYTGAFGRDFEDGVKSKVVAQIARGKCELSWTYERSTHELLTLSPNLAEADDPKWQGGAFYRGIAVGISGFKAPIDEMGGMWLATSLVARAQLLKRALDETPINFFQ